MVVFMQVYERWGGRMGWGGVGNKEQIYIESSKNQGRSDENNGRLMLCDIKVSAKYKCKH